MLNESRVFTKLPKEQKVHIDQIVKIFNHEFIDEQTSFIEGLFCDVIGLFEGLWKDYQKCQTGYHNLSHAIDVALVTARMIAGHNLINKENKISHDHFELALVAALFHDTGYIKDKKDQKGKGGKYTFAHVERSVAIARRYLTSRKLPTSAIELITKIISSTEFSHIPEMRKIFADQKEIELAEIVGTADLIAQMADVDYMENIRHLFGEFEEAYEFYGPDYLKEHNIKNYSSADEMIRLTLKFYQEFVIPRLEAFGRKDNYLVAFFGDGRNPYLENIKANLSGKMVGEQTQWKRIGNLLQDLGVVNGQQVDEALKILKNIKHTNGKTKKRGKPFNDRFLKWLEGNSSPENLGDVLIEMDAVDPKYLRQGLIDQILTPKLLKKITKKQLHFLLETSIMLQNISKDHWVFEQVLLMANKLLSCEASSILLAHPNKMEMLFAVSTYSNKEFHLGRTTPIDKGLSGWVFLHEQPAIIGKGDMDERFDMVIENRGNMQTESILAVPLHINGKPIGVMEFINKKKGYFEDKDMQIMMLLANLIALSLNSALRLAS